MSEPESTGETAGLFGSKRLKIGVLSGGGLYAYDIESDDVNQAGLVSHVQHPDVQRLAVGSVSKTDACLTSERMSGSRTPVIVHANGGMPIAEINDRGLWEIVVRCMGRMKLNGVRCSLRVEMDPDTDTLLVMSLDLPSGFPADLTSSPHFRVIELDPEQPSRSAPSVTTTRHNDP